MQLPRTGKLGLVALSSSMIAAGTHLFGTHSHQKALGVVRSPGANSAIQQVRAGIGSAYPAITGLTEGVLESDKRATSGLQVVGGRRYSEGTI